MLWVTWGQISETLIRLFWFRINGGVFSEHTKQSKGWGFSIYRVRTKLWVQSPGPCKPGWVVHAWTLCKWEMQAEGTRVQSHPPATVSLNSGDLIWKVKRQNSLTFLELWGLLKALSTGEMAFAVKSTCCCRKLSSHMVAHQPSVKSSSHTPNALFWTQAPGTHMVSRHTCNQNTQIQKNNNKLNKI